MEGNLGERQIPFYFNVSCCAGRTFVFGANNQVGEQEAVSLLTLTVRLKFHQESILDQVSLNKPKPIKSKQQPHLSSFFFCYIR